MSVPVIVQPDLEAWVWANVSDLPGVNSFGYAATQMWPGWVYAHFIQLDARSKRKEAARATAEVLRQRMCALPDVPWDAGVVCYVQPVEGPFWLPDDDGLPRYTARYEIRVHPLRDSGAVQASPLAHPAAARRPST
jgi:hypothetical protein